MVQGLIFDFNGTMFQDSELQEQAWRTYLAAVSGKEITKQQFIQYVHGRTNEEILARLLNRALPPEEAGIMAEEKEAVYRRICLENAGSLVLTQGLEDFLNQMAEQKIPMTIATASIKSNVDFFIETFQLNRWFDPLLIAYDDGKMAGKPAPDIYLKAAEYLQVSPAKCLVFEDSISGIKSAFAARVQQIVGVAAGEKQALLKEMPGIIAVIEDFAGFSLPG